MSNEAQCDSQDRQATTMDSSRDRLANQVNNISPIKNRIERLLVRVRGAHSSSGIVVAEKSGLEAVGGSIVQRVDKASDDTMASVDEINALLSELEEWL